MTNSEIKRTRIQVAMPFGDKLAQAGAAPMIDGHYKKAAANIRAVADEIERIGVERPELVGEGDV